MCPNLAVFDDSARDGTSCAAMATGLRDRRLPRALPIVLLMAFFASFGCTAESTSNSIVYYCDGAGWYAGSGKVQSGLKQAKFPGRFERYGWSTLLGPGTDHLIAARSTAVAMGLTRRIEKHLREHPEADVHLIGLSAGTAVVLNAIEQLPADVKVSNVVLLSSSASSQRDLTKIMQRVSGCIYNTVSRRDSILSTLTVNADGGEGRPAGAVGFRRPRGTKRPGSDQAYRRVVNLPWKPAYLAYDWDGGHTRVTSSKFIRSVIAPRLKSKDAFPLDRPMVASATKD
ncbi:MAG: hypothetical protein KF841_04705 [Phycisphaerae bacterium]|nr:hypothetical protein [Phycisphaerae bacterium]